MKTEEPNELDAMLEGIDVPEGVLAQEVLESLSLEGDAGSDGIDLDDELAGEAPSPPPIDKDAIYAAQTSTTDVAGDETAAPKKKVKVAKAPRITKPKNTATPKVVGDGVILTRSQAFAKKANPDDLVKIGIDPDHISTILEVMDGAPKKVSEKCYNLLRYTLGQERSLSNYTRFAIEQLAAAGDAGMTTPDLVKAMETRYQPGTARSQSQQMSRLFGIFGMASKDGKRMILNRESPLVKTAADRLCVAFVTSI